MQGKPKCDSIYESFQNKLFPVQVQINHMWRYIYNSQIWLPSKCTSGWSTSRCQYWWLSNFWHQADPTVVVTLVGVWSFTCFPLKSHAVTQTLGLNGFYRELDCIESWMACSCKTRSFNRELSTSEWRSSARWAVLIVIWCWGLMDITAGVYWPTKSFATLPFSLMVGTNLDLVLLKWPQNWNVWAVLYLS